MSARRPLTRRPLALLGLVALVATAFVSSGMGAASAAPGPPAPKRPHPTIGPAPGLRWLTIKTIPPVTGATFTFEGQTFTTGPDGTVTVTVTQAQRDRLADANIRNAALVMTTQTVDVGKGARATFSGWYGDGSYKDGREVQTATFSFSYLTSFRFVNPKGDPIQPSLLQSMELKSSVGATIDLKSADPIWLEGRRVTPGTGGVDVRDISYRINDVKVAGSNVVNSAQQQFFPTQRTTATVKLLFFSVRFVATDAMFGGGVGKSIELKYPDGKVRTFPLGATHSITVDDLPRGDYHVTVIGGGLRMARPLTVSRNQVADLDVITYVDVGLVLLALAIVAAAVLWFGLSMRRRHRGAGTRVARRRHPAASEPPAPLADAVAATPSPTNGNGRHPVPAATNGAPSETHETRETHDDEVPTYVGSRRHEDASDDSDLEFLHTSAHHDDASRPVPSADAVAEAFADTDAEVHARAADAEVGGVPSDPGEVSANEDFLVDGPGRRRR